MNDLGVSDDELLDFLAELTELSKKYRILIGGCGCCGSPYLQSPDGISVGSRVFDIDDFQYTYDDRQPGYSRDNYLSFME